MKLKNLFFSLTCFLSPLCMTATTPNILSSADEGKMNAWVDSVFNTLTVKQQIEQLFVPKVNPANLATAKTAIHTYVVNNGVGGLLFSKGSIDNYAKLIDYARSLAKVPLMITLDGEWGLSMRVPGTTKFPYNMTLGAITNDTLLYKYGQEVARQCRRMGIQVNFAPVLDVNSNPDNPVIGYRSFGENPRNVSRLGIAYSKGLEDNGVMAVSKHFPGHGDTNQDSHATLPTVNHSLATLKESDLVPFTDFIDNGLSGVMVAHLNVPALDASGNPSSMSRKITTGLLKDQLGFEGLVWTDGLAMKGADIQGNKSLQAFKAGADVLLESLTVKADIAAFLSALEKGEITKEEIADRCRKVLKFKYALGLGVPMAQVYSTSLKSELNTPEAEAINRELIAASVTCLSNKDGLLPIHNLEKESIATVNIGTSAHNTFSEYCAKYAKVDAYGTTAGLSPATLSAIKKHDIVIAAVYNDKAASIADLKKLEDCKNLIVVFFMNPYKIAKFAPVKASAIIWEGEDNSIAHQYGAQALFGGIRINGTLPVTVEGVAKEGTGIGIMKTRLGYASPANVGIDSSMKKKIDSLVSVGLRTGAFPGCQVLVAKDGYVVFDKSYGYTDNTKLHKVNDSTIYDLASVSKVTGTLPGIMKAYDENYFQLNEPVSKFVPELKDTDKKDITVAELLYHESGLPATIDMNKLMIDTASYTGKLYSRRMRGDNTIRLQRGLYANRNARLRKDLTSSTESPAMNRAAAHNIYVGEATRDTIFRHIYDAKLRPTKKYLYSDLNFALLMNMEENITGVAHENWVENNIFGPLGAYRTGYIPLKRYKAADIAATEKDNFLRRQMLKGYVHDELAAYSGGVQGNAGLFSNANDLAKLGQMWLNGGTYGGAEILSLETIKVFTESKSPNSRRRLGFDAPDTDDIEKTPTAPEAHASTYGHIGFTGTSIWIDPANNLIYIFLSNRINPSRSNPAFNSLNIRPNIMSAIYGAF